MRRINTNKVKLLFTKSINASRFNLYLERKFQIESIKKKRGISLSNVKPRCYEMIFNRVRFDRPGVVNLPRGSFLASRETIVQSRPSRSRSSRPPSEDYINSASRVPQVANWALASCSTFLPRCVRSPNDQHDQRLVCHVRSRENYFFLPPRRTDFDGGPTRAEARGEGRRRKSTEGGKRRRAWSRVHGAGTPKILWMDTRGWPKWSVKWSVAILRLSRFFLFLESPETRLFFDKISHGESNRVSGNNTRIVVRYTATNRVHVNETS